jgi:hypothetical protein
VDGAGDDMMQMLNRAELYLDWAPPVAVAFAFGWKAVEDAERQGFLNGIYVRGDKIGCNAGETGNAWKRVTDGHEIFLRHDAELMLCTRGALMYIGNS